MHGRQLSLHWTYTALSCTFSWGLVFHVRGLIELLAILSKAGLTCIGRSSVLVDAWGGCVMGRSDVLFAPPDPLALSISASRDLAVSPCM